MQKKTAGKSRSRSETGVRKMRAQASPSVIGSTSDLSMDPRNPRTISDAAAAGLSVSLSEFGDLSGIVFNAQTQQLVCGHQRVGEIRKRWGDLPIDGDVIRSPEGHEFRVRWVDWPMAKQRAANIAANSQRIAGEFTDELDVLLSEVQAETPELFDSLLFSELLHETISSTAAPDLATGDRQPFQSMTFTVHDSQAETIKAAIAKASRDGHHESLVNANTNGNAIAWVCQEFLNG